MDIALPGFILGYHGCDAKVAQAVIAGQDQLKPSNNDYDWLGGKSIYFWEHNAQRAFDFAKQMQKRPHPSGQTIKTPAVIGAVIDLGFCLNLLDSSFMTQVKEAYEELDWHLTDLDQPMPKNENGPDRVDRKLDCAVFNMLHAARERASQRPFDSVRAAFFEGKPIYAEAGFASKTHIQVAIRDTARIVGYFYPLDEYRRPRKFK